jgi:hypothetical protein
VKEDNISIVTFTTSSFTLTSTAKLVRWLVSQLTRTKVSFEARLSPLVVLTADVVITPLVENSRLLKLKKLHSNAIGVICSKIIMIANKTVHHDTANMHKSACM